MTNEKKYLSELKGIIKKYPSFFKLLVVFLISIIIIPIAIWLVYYIGTKYGGISTDFSAGDILTFYGTFLSFLGTIILGAAALWQNYKLSQQNKEISNRPYFVIDGLTDWHSQIFDNEKEHRGLWTITAQKKLFDGETYGIELPQDNEIKLRLKNVGQGVATEITYGIGIKIDNECIGFLEEFKISFTAENSDIINKINYKNILGYNYEQKLVINKKENDNSTIIELKLFEPVII